MIDTMNIESTVERTICGLFIGYSVTPDIVELMFSSVGAARYGSIAS